MDDRLTLWVNGRSIYESGVEYERGDDVLVPTAADLSPAGVAVRNGSVTVSDLVLKRDIYYTQNPGQIDYGTVFEIATRGVPRNSSISFPILPSFPTWPGWALRTTSWARNDF